MVYPFVQAASDYGVRKGPVRAFVVHMAEGGGTVGFLSRPNDRGVSVHYVVEKTGRIVQMLREDHASGSINPGDLRTTDDPSVFGATVGRKVMGEWWTDPNSAVISCEVEGYAAAGPNATEHASLKRLIDDVRSRYPAMGLLGHRDFQDYKACPGRLIHWDELGGHGPAKEGDDVKFIQASGLAPDPSLRLLPLPANTPLYGFDGVRILTTGSADGWPYVGLVDGHSGEKVIVYPTGKVYADGVSRPTQLVAKTAIAPIDAPVPVTTTTIPTEYAVTVGGKAVGTVILP